MKLFFPRSSARAASHAAAGPVKHRHVTGRGSNKAIRPAVGGGDPLQCDFAFPAVEPDAMHDALGTARSICFHLDIVSQQEPLRRPAVGELAITQQDLASGLRTLMANAVASNGLVASSS